MVIITSRPIYSFIAYSKFSIFDIMPLTKAQALELVQKLEFWDDIAKNNFLTALDRNLYTSHYQFVIQYVPYAPPLKMRHFFPRK